VLGDDRGGNGRHVLAVRAKHEAPDSITSAMSPSDQIA